MIRKFINKLNKTNSQFLEIHSLVKTLKFFTRKCQMEDFILHCNDIGVSNEHYCNHNLIVSLTSYGKRIYDVCYTIESLMQQTLKPNKIVLWLGKELENTNLPSSLQRQVQRGLEICYTEDIRSYKKLIPALREFPNDIIITVDDDVIYEFDIIERLFKSYLSNPNKIHAARTHRMRFNKNGGLLPYNQWEWNAAQAENSRHLFFTGGAGTLFPPKSLHEDVMNKDIFMDICPTADDVWFNAMALKNGTQINKVATRNNNSHDYLENYNMQDMGLFHINVLSSARNDEQIHAVYNKYDLFQLL